MAKYTTTYQEVDGQIVKVETVDGVQVVTGEVVNPGMEAWWNPFKWVGKIFKTDASDHVITKPPPEIVTVKAVDTFNIEGHPDYQYRYDYPDDNPHMWDGVS